MEQETLLDRSLASVPRESQMSGPLDDCMNNDHHHHHNSPDPLNRKARPLKLLTAAMDNKILALRVIVAGAPFLPPPGYAPQDSFIGLDGNKYYCQVCKQLGEIVCCDGCPRAYHPGCLPREGDSRVSLLRDDDPWFCPVCWESKEETNRHHRHDEGPTKHANNEDGLRLVPADHQAKICRGSTSYDHGPRISLLEENDVERNTSEPPKASELVPSNNGRKRQSRSVFPKPPQGGTDYTAEDPVKTKIVVKRRKKNDDQEGGRKRRRADSHADRPAGRATNTAISSPQQASPSSERIPADPLAAALGNRTHGQGLVQATPAFYYFLSESRWKIERHLSKSHRYFNRLSKGNLERNALVAKEAAIWWTKLRPAEYQRYVHLSMQEFEQRIIGWKEDKNMQEMAVVEAEDLMAEPQSMAETDADTERQREMHERLHQTVSVAQKVFERKPDVIYNKVLLAALKDARCCHESIPMFSVNRSDQISGNKTSIKVHGPVATSIGDECLGCTHGWSHHCKVLQHRLPAVKRRAKVQPGLSSLMATRVGLGLAPRWQKHEGYEGSSSACDELEWRQSKQNRKQDNILPLSCHALTSPSSRVDDIALFIEGASALAISPQHEAVKEGAKQVLASNSNYLDERGSAAICDRLYQCSRCRRIITTKSGCIDCRRAQLVLSLTKQRKSEQAGPLTVQSIIIGRLHSREKTIELTDADRAVAKRLLKPNWLPIAFLPPQPARCPRKVMDAVSTVENAALEVEETEHEEEFIADGICDAVGSDTELSSEGLTTKGRADEPIRSSTISLEMGNGDNRMKTEKDNSRDWHKHVTFIACAAIYIAELRHDPLRLFTTMKQFSNVEEATEATVRPIDFDTIRSHLLGNQYNDVDSIANDIRTMCNDACNVHPIGSVHVETANKILNHLARLEKTAKSWSSAILDAIDKSGVMRYTVENGHPLRNRLQQETLLVNYSDQQLKDLATGTLESRLRQQLKADLMRTQENEVAYYGVLAVRRAAAAAKASLAMYPNSVGTHSSVHKRSHLDDEELRHFVDHSVAALSHYVQLQDISSLQEESIVRVLRTVRARRIGLRNSKLDNGCSRCNTVQENSVLSKTQTDGSLRDTKQVKHSLPRIDSSRKFLATGRGSDEICLRLANEEDAVKSRSQDVLRFVSIQKSEIHGVGLFADKPFTKGDVICEMAERGISSGEASAVDQHDGCHLLMGRLTRYINHSCQANCSTSYPDSNLHSKQTLIVANASIAVDEEITYDYQMPIERDLSKRISCHCGSAACRGFMNWPYPEGEFTKVGLNRSLT